MKKIFLAVIFCFGIQLLSAQAQNLEAVADSIQAEGETLYKSEWASWHGTDIFLEKCKDKQGKFAGYISYDNGKGLVNIFFSKGAEPRVLATTEFDYGFDKQKYRIDTTTRMFNAQEAELYAIRVTAIKRMSTDTIFKFYKNTSLNPVPIIEKGVKKVYALTGPSINGVVVFGNDYQMDFNKENAITAVTKLHSSILLTDYKTMDSDSTIKQEAAMHSHVKGKSEFMNATDICTLMLYEHFTTWQTYYVMSAKYVSIWDCKKNSLLIITRKAWDRIYKDQKTRHPEKN